MKNAGPLAVTRWLALWPLLLTVGCSRNDAPSGSTGGTGGVAPADDAVAGTTGDSGGGTGRGSGGRGGASGGGVAGTGGADDGGAAGSGGTDVWTSGGADPAASGSGGSPGVGGGDGAADAAGGAGFRHPGILHTQVELDRMRAKVDAGAEPWKSGWDRLVASSFAQTSYQPNPQQEVCAGGSGSACPNGETYMPLARDCAAAYQNALRYRVSGDAGHADKAISILNAWSSTLVQITGDSNGQLRAGLYGYQLAAAAELVRDYPGWAASDPAHLKDMMVTIFYATCSRFLQPHNGTCFDHHWANWDLANMSTVLAVAVLTDDRAKFDEAVTYFKSGVGTGQVDRLVSFLYPGNPVLGQGQESGRDQGHATLSVALAGAFAKMAYDQGEDLFAYEDNKLLALAEYTAKYSLGEDVPWTSYTNCENSAMTAISSSGRGAERPNWELFYNHYAKVKGLYAPHSQRFAELLRPERGGGDYGTNSGGFDQLDCGTLAFSEE